MIYDKYLCNICVMYILGLLLLLGTSIYKPIITSCSVNSTVNSARYQHTVTLDWELLNKVDTARIREYWIYCTCTDYKTDLDKVCIYMHKLFFIALNCFIKTYVCV